jgi:hypothetical protein
MMSWDHLPQTDTPYQFAAAVGLASVPDALQAPGTLGLVGLTFSAVPALPAVFRAATGLVNAVERLLRMLRTPVSKLPADPGPASAPAADPPRVDCTCKPSLPPESG